MKEDALAWHISTEEWAWFATLTFADDVNRPGRPPSEKRRYHMLFAWLRYVACFSRGDTRAKRWASLLWVVRHEEGEISERPHFHVLIGGIPKGFINPSTRFKLSHRWSEIIKGGFCDVRAYNNALPGVEYVLKGLRGQGYSLAGANAYEVSKYNERSGAAVSLSSSCLGKWGWRTESRADGKHMLDHHRPVT